MRKVASDVIVKRIRSSLSIYARLDLKTSIA